MAPAEFVIAMHLPDRARWIMQSTRRLWLSQCVGLAALAEVAVAQQHAHDAVYDAAQEAFLQGKPFGTLLAADPRVTAHMTPDQITSLLDPTAYTGLCADMARQGATRARAAATELLT